MGDDALGGNASEMLRSYARRIVALEAEKQRAKEQHIDPLTADIKDVRAEARSQGFDTRALGEAIKRARMDPDLRETVELYEAALVDLLLGSDEDAAG